MSDRGYYFQAGDEVSNLIHIYLTILLIAIHASQATREYSNKPKQLLDW